LLRLTVTPGTATASSAMTSSIPPVLEAAVGATAITAITSVATIWAITTVRAVAAVGTLATIAKRRLIGLG
jgi:hypothetical protein